MKVCFVSTFPPLRCGIGRYTEMLAGSLIEKNVAVSILTEKSVRKVESKGLEIIPCFNSKENFVDPILKRVEEIRPDVVHIQHDYTRYSPYERFIQLLEELHPFRTLVTMHAVLTRETSDYHPYCEKLNKRIGELATVIVHQKAAKQVFLRIGVPAIKIKVIPHGTLLLTHAPDKKGCFNVPEQTEVLAQFGFLKEQKQAHISIKAMPIILKKFPKAHLFIGGTVHPYYRDDNRFQDYVNYCLELIRELKLSKSVRLLNEFLPQDFLERYICSADVILFPERMNYWSASGMLHLALGAEKPIVTARAPKFDEISCHVSDELVFLPGDRVRLAKIVIRLLADHDFRTFIVKRIKSLALDTSWDNVAYAHMKVYSRIKKV